MALLICAKTLTDGWLAALEHLYSSQDREQLNLITAISDPHPDLANTGMIDILDDYLVRKGKERVSTVANTIFPIAYLRGVSSRDAFYDRYLDSYDRIRRKKGNGSGTYFGRLIQYPATADVRNGETMNQIEGIIKKLSANLKSGNPKRFAYQAQIFAPGRDDRSQMGFPCLSFLSFQLDQGRLCLTAVYRNQYYFERALGNFIGLARLQCYVAEHVNLKMGSLTIHACHAEIDRLGMRETQRLVRACHGWQTRAVAA